MKNLIKKARNVKDIREIASAVADSIENFGLLISCMENNDRHLASMAAWAMSNAAQLNPALLNNTSFHQMLVEIARKTTEGGIKRNIVRAWQFAKLPETMVYDIADIALAFLSSPREDIAVKAFSITVLQNCLKQIPELKEEVVFLVEKEMEYGTAALIVRGRKLLKMVSGMKN